MGLHALIYGGAGTLGQSVVKKFNAAGWDTFSVDLFECPSATHSLTLKTATTTDEDLKNLLEQLKHLQADLSVVIHVAGGWIGGSAASLNLVSTLNRLFHQNLESAFAASHIALKSPLKKDGFLVLTGAQAGLGPTPGMVAYGVTKAATHHLVASLASTDNKVFTDLGVGVVGVLPITLDTPSNRQAMPGANFDEWTPTDELADKIVEWAQQKNRPSSGSLVVVKTTKKSTEFVVTPNPFLQ